jgi:Sap, sulfolipid-1-addressing protein
MADQLAPVGEAGYVGRRAGGPTPPPDTGTHPGTRRRRGLPLSHMGDAVVYALGVAVSPVPIAAVLIMLSGPGASGNSLAFAAGWIVGLAIAAIGFALLVNCLGLVDSRPAWISAAELAVGLGFLVAATRLWLHRASGGSPSARLDVVDRFTPVRAAVLGVVLSAANPKVLALSLGAALSVARSGANVMLAGSAAALFVGIGAVGVVTPIAVYFAVPTQGAVGLARVRTGIGRHEGVVLAALAVAIGIFFLRAGAESLAS